MARPKSIPKIVHHKASGRDRVRIDGHDFYLGPHGSRQAKRRYKQLIAEHLAAGDVEAGPVETVAELVDHYLKHLTLEQKRRGQRWTELTHARTAMRFLLAVAADCPVEDFGPRRLKAVRMAMVDSGRLNRQAVNGHVTRIRTVFSWAAEDELIDPAHPRRLECVRPIRKGRVAGLRESRRRPTVPWEHVAAALGFMPKAVAAMVQLQWLTGMRPEEVRIMRTGDVDTAPDLAGAGGDVWLYAPARAKTDHLASADEAPRIVALGPQAVEILRPWLRAELGEYLFQPRESEQLRNVGRRADRTLKPWPSHDPDRRSARRRGRGGKSRRPGVRYTKDSYGRAVARAVGAAAIADWERTRRPGSHLTKAFRTWLAGGVRTAADRSAWRRAHGGDEAVYAAGFLAFYRPRRFSPYRLRHSFATRARRVLAGLDHLQAAMGHRSQATTEIYARIDVQKAVVLARRIG